MTMSANIHGLKSVKAKSYEGTTWLEIGTKDGCSIAIHMPFATAQGMAAVFNVVKDAEKVDAAEEATL